ncbi:MAG TPA: hypothetical protein VMF06_00845, partial [Candidatus Limnocylindria bacterium]|nr:hypothetical protein [Candidatus Limnocylindria bacterium]
ATSLRNTHNGQWTLSVSDLEGGSLARLRGWTLNLTGVPEPGTYAVVTGLALAALGLARAGSRRFR